MLRRDTEAVESVLAAVLVIGIVVVMAIGVWIFSNRLSGETGDAPDALNVAATDAPDALGGATDDPIAILELRGGGTVDIETYRFSVEGATVSVKAAQGGACTANDVIYWEPGEFVCLVEQGTDIAAGDLQILIVHEARDSVVFNQVLRVA